ncbi:uncharacterized protein B0H18DRAFT_952364 [Fomitopsis serialis]|uniref:uncharacterized protein n=1 Tax=Fomitopsis serialis TaxID=139415 RepID=UPI0020075052|nr:uncharacterized protein B0H18DRAFT_952364 [Neoantrodia serialis]KAH9932213.1 hypothetical protein B0H18DRAFT_952364 [Neoantrodia serialis]
MKFKLGVAEMNYDDFMALYMPGPDLPPNSELQIPAIDRTTLFSSTEGPICRALCTVAQAIFDGCPHGDPKLVAKDTRGHPGPDVSDRLDFASQEKVGVCFYPDHDDAKSEHTLPAQGTRRQAGFRGRTCWAWVSLPVEVKTDHRECASQFEEKLQIPEGKSEDALQGHLQDDNTQASQHEEHDHSESKTLVRSDFATDWGMEQQAACVAKLLGRQHRVHCFTMYVFKGQARVVRWDRAGAIVSTPIDFEKDPSLLHRVIWRYACMTEAQRGFDPTVRRATEEEVKKMRDCHTRNDWADKSRKAALDQDGWPAYTITMPVGDRVDQTDLERLAPMVPCEDDSVNKEAYANRPVEFVVGKRYFASNSPTGRGTKCYIAYEVARDRLVFLKDYWRADTDSSLQEGQVLEDLRKAGVQFVPTPLFRGHVRSGNDEQKTCTQAFLLMNPRSYMKPAALKHYRLVVKEIGRPLEEHEDAFYLVGTLFQALEAHKQAWVKKKIMHRDMSARNILLFTYIDAEGKVFVFGMLIDWDLCKHEKYLGTAMNTGRSGTWPFMSARLLRNPGKKHELADDLEAVVHILRWMTLRFYKHSMSDRPEELRAHVLGVYETQGIVNGEAVGGTQKYDLMVEGYIGVNLEHRDNPLAKLLSDLAKICKEHYLVVGREAEPAQVTAVKPSVSDSNTSTNIKIAQQSWFASVMSPPLPRIVGEAPNIAVAPPRSPSQSPPPPPGPPPPSPLSTHDAILGAFCTAFMSSVGLYEPLEKLPDQFAAFKHSTIAQYSIERSSQQSSGSKRTLEAEPEELAKPGPSKRARAANTGGLESLPEEPAAEPVLHDGED